MVIQADARDGEVPKMTHLSASAQQPVLLLPSQKWLARLAQLGNQLGEAVECDNFSLRARARAAETFTAFSPPPSSFSRSFSLARRALE